MKEVGGKSVQAHNDAPIRSDRLMICVGSISDKDPGPCSRRFKSPREDLENSVKEAAMIASRVHDWVMNVSNSRLERQQALRAASLTHVRVNARQQILSMVVNIFTMTVSRRGGKKCCVIT